MTRKTAVLAVVALVVAGTTAALAGGTPVAATSDASLAQETTTVEDANETTTTADGETVAETTTAEEMVGADTASVIFLNQSAGFTFTGDQPNKTTVLIERVVVPEGGFVVVHDAENVSGDYEVAENVSVGAVIGNSTYLEPGVHSNVAVEIDESINESQTLIAMPHRDTNDNQQYDFPEADDPYVMDGSPVIETAFIIIDYDVIDATLGNAARTTEAGDEETTVENETTTEA